MIVLVMGVSGAGKTTVGARLARELGWELVDADDFHPAANIEKMRSGKPLDDRDRAPWIAALTARIRQLLDEGRGAVIACSALKAAYRAQLLVDPARMRLVHLTGDPALIAARLSARKDHFMPAGLLATQLAALEPPEDAIRVDISGTPEEIVAAIRRALGV
ncbi:gluconokinase [Sorangium atrum]|uniref:Gluconokinase n=1 Tax=Sorangium atrum TaxID=2995308 RepID=A0ABT5CCD7_9BACT|nr:gluconokinase [Sorangium aterium]MDC0682791.1 gluconokinase [Sorangium aterium]